MGTRVTVKNLDGKKLLVEARTQSEDGRESHPNGRWAVAPGAERTVLVGDGDHVTVSELVEESAQVDEGAGE